MKRTGLPPEIEAVFAQIANRIRQTLLQIPAPSGTVYVCGFWLFYCDYSSIGAPCLAYNILGSEADEKWCPPDWYVDVDDQIHAVLAPLYLRLTELMHGEGHSAWDALLEHQWGVYADLSKSITRDARSLLGHWRLTDDFVCGIFEGRDGEEVYVSMVRASVDETIVAKLEILSDN